METGRPGKKIALPHLVRTVLVAGLLAAASCAGVEADVLSLRPVPDLAVADAPPAMTMEPGPPGCKTQSLSTKECLDVSSWNAMTQMVCSSLGLVPGRLALMSMCPMGTAQAVRFECCPAQMCSGRLLGDAMSCRDGQELVDSATLDCKLRGEMALLLTPIETCAPGRYRMMKYLCCPPGTMPTPTPTPPPGMTP